ncbi:LysR family transcriptional regulator [Rouxiella badensis]|uniref:LysR family transcriptional regulator n=1 Tax=Rouxiella badensis TaxID=1646377 RepID=UPI001D13D45A|nr:LysR family transcriptional regulator [Rouxiella badensis]MCC3719674.1 LysR family transcriptional regulator [Rouxiella badensis]MCC3728924.1 LysR family transcriptional regulator [Rouxiella badensis]MCC3733351.1 LysR family transcriptional regulator [Rouxiella badensis]MCC3740880.1 LysR family transcriptional regulator [Rouxiella badensis]MCC3757998.1 LysR family transcriptional regulator [Rouxiella badensis]
MNNKDLIYFLKVAELKHLGYASQNLNLTQPALSKSIARLEKLCQTRLFKRLGRGLELTEAGRLLYQRGLVLQNGFDETLRQIAEMGAGLSGVVRLGSAGSTTQFLLPAVCREMQLLAPNIKLEIQIGMNDVLYGMLGRNELDFILGPIVKGDKPVITVPVTEDHVVVAASRNHPLAGKEATAAQLSRCGWILPAKSVAMRKWLDRYFFDNHCPALDVRIEISSLAAAPELIAESGLLSFISENSLSEEVFASRLVRVKNDDVIMARSFGITYLAENTLSPAAQRVIEVIQDYKNL